MSGKRERPGLPERIRAIPHRFAKMSVIYCVAFASGASIWALRILSRTGHDPANLLAIILGFFGGELLIMGLKTITEKRGQKDE